MTGLVLAALLAQPAQSSPPASPAAAPSDAPAAAATASSPGLPHERLPATFPPAPPEAAVIRNSGSTNTAGYTLIISPDGSAVVRQYDSFERKVVAAPQTRWLFLKVQQAAPLDSAATTHCVKSASFGTSTTVVWNERSTGDLSCAADSASRELLRTIGVIVRELGVDTRPQPRRLHPL